METERLVRSAQRGDEHAFYELMQQNKVQLYKMAYSYLNNENDALDAVQETTYRAYVKIGQVREPSYFKTWLMRIMIHYCKDELKKRSRYSDKELTMESIPNMEDSANLHENRMNLQWAVGKLELKYQSVIQLKYYQDMTIPEIARTLNRPEGTIKTWLNKALHGMRQHLKKEGDFYD